MAAYWGIAAHLAYDVLSWNKYNVPKCIFPSHGLWSGNLFLIVPFPDHCLLFPSCSRVLDPPVSTDRSKAILFSWLLFLYVLIC